MSRKEELSRQAARLFADQQITFVSRIGEAAGGDSRVGDLALAFGNQGNVGSGGTIKVDAGGAASAIAAADGGAAPASSARGGTEGPPAGERSVRAPVSGQAGAS